MLEIEPGRLLDYKEIPETEETNGYVKYDTTAIDAESLQILTQ